MKSHLILTAISWLLLLTQIRAESAHSNVTIQAELDRPVLPAESKEKVVIKISLLPEALKEQEKRPPLNLVIALDCSGSMGGQKIEHAREGALVALSMLKENDRFALVTYADDARLWIPSQYPLNREKLANRIRQIQAGGSTALFAGVTKAAEVLRRWPSVKSINRIILLSDGRANVGPSSPKSLGQLGHALAEDGIVVSTIGLGLGYNEDLMTALAESGQGNTYFAEGPEDLHRIFETELEDLLSIVATDVKLTIRCAPGVRPLGSIGRKAEFNDNEVTFEISQLFDGQERYALLELEIPEGKAGDVRDLVSVTVEYLDSLSGDNVQRQVKAQASYTHDHELVKASTNLEIIRNVMDNRLAETKREAIALSDAGKNMEASMRLELLAREISSLNASFRDDVLDKQIQSIEEKAALLRHTRLNNAQRKAYMEDSYRTMYQQRSSD